MIINKEEVAKKVYAVKFETLSGNLFYQQGKLVAYMREIYSLSTDEFKTFYVHGVLNDGEWYESEPLNSIEWEMQDSYDNMYAYCTIKIEDANPPIGIVNEYEVQYGSIYVTHDMDGNHIRSHDISTDTWLHVDDGVMYILGNYLNLPRISGRPDFSTDAEFFQLSLLTAKLEKLHFIEYHLLKLDELNTLLDFPKYPKTPTKLIFEDKNESQG